MTFKRWAFLLFLMGISLHIPLISLDNTWLDEQWTILSSRLTYGEVLNLIRTEDVQPPLYYLTAKTFFTLFGESILSLRILSLLGILAMGCLALFPVRRLWGDKVSLIFCMFALLAPYTFYLGLELRAYMWNTFFTTAVFVFSVSVFRTNRPRDYCYLIFYSLCGLLTNYYVGLFIVLCWIILFFRLVLRDKKYTRAIASFCISSFCAALLYLPWLLVFFEQWTRATDGGFWIQMNHVYQSLSVLYSAVFIKNGLIMTMMILCWISILMFTFTKKRQYDFLVGLFLFISIIVFSFLYSYFIQPMLMFKYLVPFMGLFFLLCAISLQNVKKLPFCVFIVCFILSTGNLIIQMYQKVHHDGIKQMISFIDENVDDKTLIITDTAQTYFNLLYYLPHKNFVFGYRNKLFMNNYVKRLNLEETGENFYLFSLLPQKCTGTLFIDKYFYPQYYCLTKINNQ